MKSLSEMPMCHCNKCGEEKALIEFRLCCQSKSGYGNRCRVCCQAVARAQYEARKIIVIATDHLCRFCGVALNTQTNWRPSSARTHLYSCKYCKAQKELHTYRLYAKPRRDYIRAEMLAAYGGRCVCCGETEPKFLGIDHIFGGGGKHRRALGAGIHFYRWLRKLKYPKDKYRLLCHNCNQAVGLYGACPHQEKQYASTTFQASEACLA